MRNKIFMWKTLINCEDKKPQGLRPTNLNLLFKIKLHRFTWPLYLKDLPLDTYNLIHLCDATTSYYPLIDPSATLNVFNPRFKDRLLEWEIENDMAH